MLPHVDVWGASISTYLATLVLALGAGTVVAVERGRRDGLAGRPLAIVAAAASLAGVAGSRVWSLVLERWVLLGEIDGDGLLAGSGFGLIGGLIAGAAAACGTARLVGLPLADMASALSPGVATGIAVGRLGCLLAGCCFGKPTLFPIALVFEDWDTTARPVGVPLHATQLYETAGAGMLAVGLWFAGRNHRLGLLLVGYGVLRSLVEPLRADYRGTVAGVPTTQAAAFCVILIGCLLWMMIASLRTREGAGAGPRTGSGPTSPGVAGPASPPQPTHGSGSS